MPPINVNNFDLRDSEQVFRSRNEGSKKTTVNVHEASKLELFSTAEALAKYSKENGRVYPKKVAKKQGALRFMLRRLGWQKLEGTCKSYLQGFRERVLSIGVGFCGCGGKC